MLTKPIFVALSDADWRSLTDDQQRAAINNFALFKATGAKGKPPTAPIPTATATAPAPEASKDDLSGIRNWNESVRGISAERLRNCIIYQLDVKKDQWYSVRLTRKFVRDQAERLNDDTPDDFVFDPNPLFGFNTIHSEDGDIKVEAVLRDPKNNAERIKIRNKFGVNYKTIKFLVKKDCPRCKGKGTYSESAYPGDPVYGRLTETIECSCSYE
jgi:hypothetical protein